MTNKMFDNLPTEVHKAFMELETLIEDQKLVIDSQRRAMELQSKGFLRCARDLGHCASDARPGTFAFKNSNHYRARADMWSDMANSPTGYKDRIYSELSKQEETIMKYREYFKSNNLENTIEPVEVPF